AGAAGGFLAPHQRQPQRMAEYAELQPAQADGQVQAGEQQQRDEEERPPDERTDLVERGLQLLHRWFPLLDWWPARGRGACTLTMSRGGGYPRWFQRLARKAP